jgi:hypothetical protein
MTSREETRKAVEELHVQAFDQRHLAGLCATAGDDGAARHYLASAERLEAKAREIEQGADNG